jgi:hypothetical protein
MFFSPPQCFDDVRSQDFYDLPSERNCVFGVQFDSRRFSVGYVHVHEHTAS